MIKRDTHTVDASDKALGRVASRVALLLRGKQKDNFVFNQDMGDFVIVKNFSKVKISGKKSMQKQYYSHSGYPGGIKAQPLSKLMKENPELVLKKAVWGMLPKNKLREEQIKRLKVEM